MAAVGVCARFVRSLMESRSAAYFVNKSKSHFRLASNSASQQTTQTETKDESGEAPTMSDVEKELTAAKEKLTADFANMTDKYKRSLAETENVRQRMQKQISDAKVFAIQGFCKDLLEVADVLGKATESVPDDQLKENVHLKNLFDGLKMTESQLLKVFNKHGLSQIDPLNEKFDPNFHEALFEVPVADKDPGTVALVQKIGYKLHDRTIRPALVGVSRAVS